MLKGIPPLLTPDLLHALASMGHGDEIAIVDANFPSASIGRRVVQVAGVGAHEVLAAVLALTGTFDGLVATVASFGTFFYALGGAAIFVYRRREPEAAWRMPGYPWVPALYVGSSTLFAVTIAIGSPRDALRGAVVLLAGAGVWLAMRRRPAKPAP